MRKLVRPSLKDVLEQKDKPQEVPQTPRVRSTEVDESAGDEITNSAYMTYKEIEYYQELIDKKTQLSVKLIDGSEIVGWLEYYDKNFIRITRENEPNAFIFKNQIKYIKELDSQD